MRESWKKKRVGFLGFDGVSTLDLVGPLEAFARAQGVGGQPCYEPVLVSLTSKRFVSESGVAFTAQTTIQVAANLDTLVIPGGTRMRQADFGRTLTAWLAAQRERPQRFVSISTGIYPLAQAGLLDERQVTTHWRFQRDLAQTYPKLRVSSTSSFVKDGPFYTAGGGRAGVELAVFLIKEDCGTQTALAVAREMEIHLRPPGDDEPHFEPADCAAGPADRLAELPSFISTHLIHDLSVEILATRAALSRRHFNRLFRATFRSSPADFVEQMRLAEARRRLLMSHYSVASVGSSVGYKNPDAFRRAFERRFGLTPVGFRNRFELCATRVRSAPARARASFAPQLRVRI